MYVGGAEDDVPAAVVVDGVAIFEDYFEVFPSVNGPDRAAASDRVEAAAGSYEEATRILSTCPMGTGAVPEFFIQILAKAEGK